MNKNTFFFILVNIVLLFPLFSLAQEHSNEIEIQYGLVKTLNHSELTGVSNGFSSYTTSNESDLVTHYYGIYGKYTFYKSFGLKMGFGYFENGRTLSANIVDDTGLTTFTGVQAKYQYLTFSLAPSYSLHLKNKLFLDIESGLMVNKTIKYLNIFLYGLKEYNFQFFIKFGLSKNINENIKISLRSTMFQGLQNFSTQNVNKGFIPLSIGGEIGVSYIFQKKAQSSEKNN